MKTDMYVFIIILIVNTIIALLYLLVNIFRRGGEKDKGEKKGGYLVKTILMLVAPISGAAVVLLSFIIFKLFFRKEVSLADVIFSKERVKTYVHAEEERERNVVPIEEAIQVTNTSDLRTLMMGVVQGDIQKTLSSITLALNSEDSEISHYAAAVLQDALGEFRDTVDSAYDRIFSMAPPEDSTELAELCSTTIDFMNEPLSQRVLSELEQKDYVHKMEDICRKFYEIAPDGLSSGQFEAICLRLLEIEDFESCGKWCELGESAYPSTLSSYTCKLKLFFNSNQKDAFFETLSELKANPDVVVDNETLELIRVFG